MASEIKHKRFSSRLWQIGLGVVLVPLVLLIAVSVWLLGTQSGAQLVLSSVSGMSTGAAHIEGVHGRLAGPMAIDRILFENDQDKITLMNVQLDWQPQALLHTSLHVTSLHVGRMIVSHKIQQKSTSPHMPQNIALPFALQIDQVKIDESEIAWGPVSIVRLGALAFQLDFDRARYRLQLAQLAARSATESSATLKSISGNLTGQATLAVAKPFALQAEFLSGGVAVLQDQAVGIKGRIGIDGSLQELKTTVQLTADKAEAQGQAVLRPFAEDALVDTNLTTHHFDIAALDSKLPHTELDINLSMAKGIGQLSLMNRGAGLYNEGRLPVAEVQTAFRQQAGQLRIEKMMSKLGTLKQPAGIINGNGQYANGALDLSLDLKALDLRRLDQRLQSTQLGGQVGIKHVANKQTLAAELSEPFGKNKIALSAHATMADDHITVERAELALGKGNVQAAGQFDLSEQNAFSAEGRMNHFRLQELGTFDSFPDMDLNGKFSLRGARQPKLMADLAFNIMDSQLAGQALEGEGKAQLRADRLLVPRMLLAIGANRLQINGELSGGDTQLLFTLDAPNLEQLGAGYGGVFQAHGSARGTFNQPHIDVMWTGDKIQMPNQLQLAKTQGKVMAIVDRNQPFFLKTVALDASANGLEMVDRKLAALTAHLQFSPQATAPLAMNIQGDDLIMAQIKAEYFSVVAQGTTARHIIDASMAEIDQKWMLKMDGGFKDLGSAARWQGTINRMEGEGRVVGHLAEAAPLTVSRQRMQLDHFVLDANDGHLAIDQFIRDQNNIVTRGNFERLQIMSLLQFANQQPMLTSDLQLAGEWNLDLANTVNGSIKVRRQSGDIMMKGSASVPLGLRNLDANVQATNGHLMLRFNADGQQVGHIDVNATANLASGANRFSIVPNTPLSGAAKLDIPSLNWIGSLISPGLMADGRLQSTVSMKGTYADPRFTGNIAARGLRLFFMEQGIDLRNGTLDGEFQNDGLVVKQLRFQSVDGDVDVTGPIKWTDGKTVAHLALKADRFVLFNRIDRRLVVSGQSQIDWNDSNIQSGIPAAGIKSRIKITGAFNVNSGFFDIGRADSPGLSDDVVIVGHKQKPANRMVADTDVKVSLGDGITLQGRGLDAILAGQIHVTSDTRQALRAQGTLTVIKGTYNAYGHKLAIEKGELLFNGPIGNPALDILAMQRGQEVEVGVSVSGTVLTPHITLVSEPSVPDTEKLSWLVLGHGLDTAGGSDLSVLQAAASALLSGRESGGVQSQLAGAFGLDEINIKTDQTNTQQRVVTLGKRLSSKLEVSYEQGIESISNVLHLRYTLSKRLSVEAETGTRSAISLFFNFLFD
ncbi:MAG TPA: translocation/assembly module TamB domain-containing protein [Burkholderiaceae bacterium]|jgi:translocation and assembly module TamB